MIFASMATFPARFETTFPIAVASLLPQVDKLLVYVNGSTSEKCSDIWREYRHEWGKVAFAFGPEMNDMGKLDAPYRFQACESSLSGNHDDITWLLVDDDIIYPPDYAERSEAALELLGEPLSIVGWGGGYLRNPPFKSYYQDSRLKTWYPDRKPFKEVTQVHFLLTCQVAFKHTALKLPNPRGLCPGADIHLAVWAQQAGVAMFGLPCKAGWIKLLDGANTLFTQLRHNDGPQTDIINRWGGPWWPQLNL